MQTSAAMGIRTPLRSIAKRKTVTWLIPIDPCRQRRVVSLPWNDENMATLDGCTASVRGIFKDDKNRNIYLYVLPLFCQKFKRVLITALLLFLWACSGLFLLRTWTASCHTKHLLSACFKLHMFVISCYSGLSSPFGLYSKTSRICVSLTLRVS